MANGLGDKLVLAISSRALFDLSDSHKVYLAQGVEAYRKYQIEHEEETLAPGDAFPLVKKLLSLNASLGRARVEVVSVSEADRVLCAPCRDCCWAARAVHQTRNYGSYSMAMRCCFPTSRTAFT